MIINLTKEISDKNAITPLNHLANEGYRVKKKTRTPRTRMIHEGFILTEGQRHLPQERKEDIFKLTPPRASRQLKDIQGMAEL